MEFQPTFVNSFDSFWRRYTEAERQGDLELMSRQLDEIRRLRAERNTFNLHDIAMSFAFRGTGELGQGNLDSAEENLQIATELDPDLPTAYHGLAQVANHSGGLGSATSLGYTVRALFASTRSMKNSGFALANFGLWFAACLVLFVVIYAVLILFRHGGLLRHELAERFEDRIGSIGVSALTAAVICLPLMLTFGFGWLPAYWLVVTFAYQSIRERALTILVLVGFLVFAPLVDFHGGWSRTQLNPLFRAAASSVSGTFEPTDVFVLQGAEQVYPEDMDLQFVIATQYKNLGEYDLSATWLRRVLQSRPGDPAAKVNLGNIYFAQRDWEGAIIEYDQTLQTNPNSAAIFYNKSLAHAENFQFREREASRARAESLDGRMVAAHEHRTGEARAVIDMRLDYEALVAKFYGLEQDRHPEPVSPSWVRAWVGGKGARFTYGALALAALLFVFERFSGRRNTRHCSKCGSAFCGRCQIGTGRRGFCTQCYHLFFIKDGVSAQARNEKMYQVRAAAQKRSIVFRVLSIVIPGGGHIVEGMPLWGAAFLLVWVSGAGFFLMGSWFYGLPDDLMGLGSSLLAYAAASVMFVALVLANLFAKPGFRG